VQFAVISRPSLQITPSNGCHSVGLFTGELANPSVLKTAVDFTFDAAFEKMLF
jgi:hypothetical protein